MEIIYFKKYSTATPLTWQKIVEPLETITGSEEAQTPEAFILVGNEEKRAWVSCIWVLLQISYFSLAKCWHHITPLW